MQGQCTRLLSRVRAMNSWNFKSNRASFTLAPKLVKYSGISLTKCVQDLYEENYKALMKDLKNMNQWKNSPCLWMGRVNIIKLSMFSRLIYRFSIILIKIAASYFVTLANLLWSLYRERKDPEKFTQQGIRTSASRRTIKLHWSGPCAVGHRLEKQISE